jgi:hypothetical protein
MSYRKLCEKPSCDLNKFINQKVDTPMHCLDIDCCQMIRSKKVIRIIESKHNGEEYRQSQRELFGKLISLARLGLEAAELRQGNDAINLQGWKFEFFLVYADFDAEGNLVGNYAKVINLDTKKIEEFSEKELQEWLAFKKYGYGDDLE